jgi:outer membrane protein OmpA-like peptidoglycan-associated protein
MIMRIQLAAVAALTLAAVACASSQPSIQLVNARNAYDRATRARAAEYDPASVLAARQALERAERVHEDDPGSAREKSYAYVAQRQAELAIVRGDTAYERAQKQRAEAEYARLRDDMNARTRAELEVTQDELQRRTEEVRSSRSDAEREREGRLEAEGRAQRALESLDQIAQVKEESRGTVITLSGQVLFVTGKAELLPAARDALTKVARALIDGDDDDPVTIEGHTDSRGNDEQNQELSRQRAEVVRDYLVGLGVKPDRIAAVGYGETRPIASNDSPEGRANNRRVEIVVGNRPGPAPGMTPASGPR